MVSLLKMNIWLREWRKATEKDKTVQELVSKLYQELSTHKKERKQPNFLKMGYRSD